MIESDVIAHLIICKNIIKEYQEYWFKKHYNQTTQRLIEADIFINGLLLSMYSINNSKLSFDYLLYTLKKYNSNLIIQSICYSPQFLIKHLVENKELTVIKRNEFQNNLLASLELLFLFYKPKFVLEINTLLKNHIECLNSVDVTENLMGI